jgi:hypothetical protein
VRLVLQVLVLLVRIVLVVLVLLVLVLLLILIVLLVRPLLLVLLLLVLRRVAFAFPYLAVGWLTACSFDVIFFPCPFFGHNHFLIR